MNQEKDNSELNVLLLFIVLVTLLAAVIHYNHQSQIKDLQRRIGTLESRQ